MAHTLNRRNLGRERFWGTLVFPRLGGPWAGRRGAIGVFDREDVTWGKETGADFLARPTERWDGRWRLRGVGEEAIEPVSGKKFRELLLSVGRRGVELPGSRVFLTSFSPMPGSP